MFGYSDTVRSSPLTVTLFQCPSTVTVSGEACTELLHFPMSIFSCFLYIISWDNSGKSYQYTALRDDHRPAAVD